MRVNVYAEEMTDRVEIISKEIDGQQFTGLRIYLELPATVNGRQYQGPFIHRPGDDDSSAVTFWGKRDLRVVLRKALDELDKHYAESQFAKVGVQCGPGQPIVEGDVLPPDQAKAMVRALADTPPADEMELRPEVAAFARLMERELRTNDARRGAEGWKGMTAAELLRMLDADEAKLRFALGAGDATKAIEQCADVANMAMMIADVTEIAARKGG